MVHLHAFEAEIRFPLLHCLGGHRMTVFMVRYLLGDVDVFGVDPHTRRVHCTRLDIVIHTQHGKHIIAAMSEVADCVHTR